jgi:hypothetical protein
MKDDQLEGLNALFEFEKAERARVNAPAEHVSTDPIQLLMAARHQQQSQLMARIFGR